MTKNSHLKKLALGALVAAVVAVSSATAKADIVVVGGVNNQGTDNVLLNPATNVLTVTGTVGQNNRLVNFTSGGFGSALLNADPSGQATVSGGTGNVNFTDISFGLANGDSFTRAVFNLNSNVTGTVRLSVIGINIDGGLFQEVISVDANGQNFYTVDAINGQAIFTIRLQAVGVTFEDLRQVRLGGGQIVQTPVPEPASMLLLGTGLAGLASGIRRRRNKKS